MRKLLLLLATVTFAFASTINVPGDYPTIQAAIDAVTTVDGDIIQIDAGTYTEALTVGKSLTFIGSGPTSNPTTIITSTASRVIKLTVTGKSFTFQNLIVEGIDTNLGIYAGSSIDINSLTMQDVIARNCKVALYLAEYWSGGVFLTTSVTNLSMDNVTLTNNKFIGAYIGKTVLTGTVTNCTITDNGYSDELPNGWQKTGLQFVNFDEASVPHVVVTNSTFSNNGAGASNIERTGLIIYTAYNGLSASEIMTVSGCSFSNHPLYAVRIKNGYNVGNTATVNGTFSSNYLDIWFNNIIGTTSSTTLVRNTFDGIKSVGASPTYDYYTIQAAIDAADADDVINVAAGIYNEHVIIDKSVILQGAGASQTTIDVSGLPIKNPHIAVEIQNGVNNVIVDGFEIIGVPTFHHSDDSVIRCGGSSGTNSNITISNNILNGFMGILFKNGTILNVVQNDITFNKNAIVIQSGCSNLLISANTITGGGSMASDPAGIYLTASSGSISGNTIQNVIGSGDRGKGIHGSSNNNLLIDDNVINNTGYDGISFWSNTHHVTISNNTLSNNVQTYTKGAGITIKGDDITIVNNNIINSGHDGIIIDKHTLATERIVINYNNISGNTDYGLNVKNSGETVDGSCNWWGATDGPSGSGGGSGDAVTGNVTFLPWLVTSNLGGSCIGGTPLGNKLGVRDDLAALAPSDDKKTDDRIKKAIKHIDKSLDDKLWEDSSYLTKKGKKVFDEEKKAVKELSKIVKEKKDKPLKDEARDAIAKLITIDESLARLMIDKANANSGDSKEIDKAEKEFDKAQKEIDKEHWDHAIDKYKKAWEHAYHALKKVGLGKYSTPTDDLTVITAPEEFSLGNNYPNPFNPTTLISYNLPEASQVTMTVYDLMGRKVKTLVQEFQPAGNHSVIWNATNDNGAKMSGGMYFYQIRAGSFQKTHKMILLK